MFRITDVVKQIIILNVLAFLGAQLFSTPEMINSQMQGWSDLGRLNLALFYPTLPAFQPHQVATHMFMHANLSHLLFNMIGLFFFGPALEAIWGAKRFLSYYFICGLGAAFLQILVRFLEIQFTGADSLYVMLGASGAVFGLLAGFAMYYPNQIISLIFPPISMKAKYFVLIYGAIELFLGISNFNTGIAHFAHLGGALFGVITILIWRNWMDYR